MICTKRIVSFALFLISQSSWSNEIILAPDSSHRGSPIRDEIAEKIKNKSLPKSINCLFLEWGRDSNPSLRKYARTRNYSVIDEDRERIFQQTNRGTFNMVPENLLAAAAQNSIKVYGVDLDRKSKEKIRSDEAYFTYMKYGDGIDEEAFKKAPSDVYERMLKFTMDERSRAMAEEIHRLFTQRKCKGGIFIVGAGHTVKEENGWPLTPVQTYFEAYRHKVSMY